MLCVHRNQKLFALIRYCVGIAVITSVAQHIRAQSVSNPDAHAGLTLRTSLLNELIHSESTRRKNIRTQILEASVSGWQTTSWQVRAQSHESDSGILLSINADGNVTSSTVGVTPQARINSCGNHRFHAIKPVLFDGYRFLTNRAYGNVVARQTPRRVMSLSSGVPVVGPIGDRLAWTEVLRRNPQTQAVVVRRVADEVLSDVDESVDAELAMAGKSWKQIRTQLIQSVGSVEPVWTASSTPESISINASFDTANTSALPDSGRIPLAEAEDIAIQSGESFVNVCLQSLPLAGVVISDTDLQQFGSSLPQLLSGSFAGTDRQTYSLPNAEPTLFSIQLHQDQPLSVQFRDGAIVLNVRFQVLPRLAAASGFHVLSVRLTGRRTGPSSWTVHVQDSTVTADESRASSAWTELIRNQADGIIAQMQLSEFPDRIDQSLLPSWLPPLNVYRIQSDQQTLRVSLQVDRSEQDD